jgi:hypothetical protein
MSTHWHCFNVCRTYNALTHCMNLQNGNCIYLNGNQQYVSLPTLDFSGLSEGFSVSLWFKYEPASSQSSYIRVFDFGTGNNQDDVIFCKAGSSSDLQLQVDSNSRYETAIVSQGFPTNIWLHYVVVFKRTGSLSTWSIYKNGVRVLESLNRVYPRIASKLNYIGRDSWNQGIYFTGKIDSFAIFQLPLQLEQAVMLFQSTWIAQSGSTALLSGLAVSVSSSLQPTEFSCSHRLVVVAIWMLM